MFKIEQQKTVIWPVSVSIPRDGGRITRSTFDAEFELLPQNEFTAIYQQDGGNDEDLLRRVLVGWQGVADPDGDPFDYSEERRELLIGIPYVRTALVSAYLDCSFGKAAARKN